jgi:hypothetical protein
MDTFQKNQQVFQIGTLYHAYVQICERIMDVVMEKKEQYIHLNIMIVHK